MVKFYNSPFASGGTRNNISDSITTDGKVNMVEGYTSDYEKDLTKDPKAKDVDRGSLNGLFFNITDAIGSLQRQGNEEWSEVMRPYHAGYMVKRGGRVWISNVDNNYAEPRDDIWEWRPLFYNRAFQEDYTNGDWSKVVTAGLLKDILGGNSGDFPANNFGIPGNWTDRFSGFGLRWGYTNDIDKETSINLKFNTPFKETCFGAAILMDSAGAHRGDSTYNYRISSKDRFGMNLFHGWNEHIFHWVAFGY